MKKKSRIEMAREIISRVKREMDRPRLTESVRNGESGLTAQAVKGPAAGRIDRPSHKAVRQDGAPGARLCADCLPQT